METKTITKKGCTKKPTAKEEIITEKKAPNDIKPNNLKIKKVKLTTLCKTCPFDVTMSSIESVVTKDNERAFSIYLDIKNISEKRIKVEFPLTSYLTTKGFEIDQDYWQIGFANHTNGILIKSGAYKRAGLFYLKNKLVKISIGDKLTIEATVNPQNVKYIVTLRCESIEPYLFTPISVEKEELPQAEISSSDKLRPAADWIAGQKKEITSLIERFELLEEKLGISFSGIYATAEKRCIDPVDYELCINFDIQSANGSPLEDSLSIRAVAYNEIGQSLGVNEEYVSSEDFIGFDSKSIQFWIDQPPTKIRLFPAK